MGGPISYQPFARPLGAAGRTYAENRPSLLPDSFHARIALELAGAYGFALASGYAVQVHGFLNPWTLLRWHVGPDLACLCKDHSMPTLIACRNGA